MTSRDYAGLVAAAMLDKQREYDARPALYVQDTPEAVRLAQDFGREYDAAPWLYDCDPEEWSCCR